MLRRALGLGCRASDVQQAQAPRRLHACTFRRIREFSRLRLISPSHKRPSWFAWRAVSGVPWLSLLRPRATPTHTITALSHTSHIMPLRPSLPQCRPPHQQVSAPIYGFLGSADTWRLHVGELQGAQRAWEAGRAAGDGRRRPSSSPSLHACSRAAADEVRTVFISGFPEDVKERELNNMLRFLPGYEVLQSHAAGCRPSECLGRAPRQQSLHHAFQRP